MILATVKVKSNCTCTALDYSKHRFIIMVVLLFVRFLFADADYQLTFYDFIYLWGSYTTDSHMMQ